MGIGFCENKNVQFYFFRGVEFTIVSTTRKHLTGIFLCMPMGCYPRAICINRILLDPSQRTWVWISGRGSGLQADSACGHEASGTAPRKNNQEGLACGEGERMRAKWRSMAREVVSPTNRNTDAVEKDQKPSNPLLKRIDWLFSFASCLTPLLRFYPFPKIRLGWCLFTMRNSSGIVHYLSLMAGICKECAASQD